MENKESTILAEKLINILRENNQTIAVAESCTGGLLGAALTDVAGASQVFMGGIIAYDNSVKQKILKVSRKTLNDYGAVSSECAAEMAASVKSLFNTEAAISITGIAGPGGGTDEKPVGTVFITTLYNNEKLTTHYKHQGNRAQVRKKSTEAALNQILKLIN